MSIPTILIFLGLAVLSVNVFVAILVAMYWQVKVLFTIYRPSDFEGSYVPWKALGNPESPQNRIGRFVAGELHPELRKRWAKAIAYAVVSFAVLGVFFGMFALVAPQHMP